MGAAIETKGEVDKAPTFAAIIAGVQPLDQEIKGVVTTMAEIKIETSEDYELTALAVVDAKKLVNRAEEFFKPFKQDIDVLKKRVLDREKVAINPLKACIASAQTAMTNWQNAQEIKRRNEEALARSMATQEMRAENEAVAKEIEAQGDKETADAMRASAASATVPVIAQSTVPKVAGVATFTDYKFEIVDAKLLPREWLIPNVDAIKNYAKAMKGQGTIAGVRFYDEKRVR